MRRARVIARTRYDDPTSDLVRDFESEQEARAFLESLGFKETDWWGDVVYFGLPAVSDHGKPVTLAGYIVRR